MAKAPGRRSNPLVLRSGMTIGSSNAESDDEFLFDCFVHYPPVELCMRVKSPAMVIAGRTGAGKTAIMRYINHNTDTTIEIDPSEMAMSYISNSDVLRFVQAIGGDLDLLFQVLWKHVLCLEFIRLRWRIENEEKSRNIFTSISQRFAKDDRKKRALRYLREWENKFWVTADQNVREITEKVERKLSGELGAELERFKAGGQYERRLSAEKKSELVARSRRIINSDQLQELHGIIDILHTETESDKSEYFILIDKLDERWVDDSIRFRMIRALLETLKSFRRIGNLKILVSLRTDVIERVVRETRDITFQREKLEDYIVRLKWTKPALKSLVNKRINRLYRRQYSGDSILFEDVFPYQIGRQDAFDYMVERTLMRPRDIIAFVNECFDSSEGQSEVSATHLRRAEIEFSRKRRDALEQEWSSTFPTLPKLLTFLAVRGKSAIGFDEFQENSLEELAFDIISDASLSTDPLSKAGHAFLEKKSSSFSSFLAEVAAVLYRVGAIGLKLDPADRFIYAHMDEPLISPELLGAHVRMRVHPMLYGAFRLQAER